MKLMISPAKKMRSDPDSLPWRELPVFLEQAERILAVLRGMSYGQLKQLWRCSDAIARLNVERLEHLDLRRGLTPALLAYEGIQYRYMAPAVFTQGEYDYVQEHLRILSGLYGILRPLDGVAPYRLEMQARLAVGPAENLYQFWGSGIADRLFAETDCVLDLASKEYSRCVSACVPDGARVVTCIFGEKVGGKTVEKGTLCKMARGEMVRYLAQCRADRPEAAQDFDRLGYRFAPEESTQTRYVFLRDRRAEQLAE